MGRLVSDTDRPIGAPQALTTARIAASILGVALVVWGVAPSVVGFALRADPWQFHKLLAGAAPLALGLAFIVLASLAGPRRIWPLRATLALSGLLIAANLTVIVGAPSLRLSIFPLLLTAGAAGTAWIALDARRRAQTRPVA